MPIYEYECSECGRIDEVIQKFSDKPLTKCKYCSGKLHKLISHSSFHLKGTGWYVTDYANASRSSASSTCKGRGEKKSTANKSENKPKESNKTTDKTS
jgi:putative FmdB family regulatory protein